jgi:hypothetical protein
MFNLSHCFQDRVESQEEIHDILEKGFGTTDTMDYKRFLYVLENVSSDIYIYILLFLLQNKPFTNSALFEYEKQKTSFLKLNSTNNFPSSPSKLVASPNIHSKFSPSIQLSKSPVMKSSALGADFKLDGEKNESKNFLLGVAGLGAKKGTNNSPGELKIELKRADNRAKTVQMNAPLKINIVEPTVPVNRKERHNLKNIDDGVKPTQKDSKNEYDDLPIIPASKVSNASIEKLELEDTSDIIFDGHLYKITDDKTVKRLWFKLVNRDLYCKLNF